MTPVKALSAFADSHIDPFIRYVRKHQQCDNQLRLAKAAGVTRLRLQWLALALGAFAGCGAEPQPVDLLISNVTIYSGADPVPLIGNVVVANDRIVAAGSSAEGPYASAVTIDGSDLYLIPGLWDAHVHLRSSLDRGLEPEDFLRYGVHPLDACEAGMDGIEHAGSFIEALVSVSAAKGWEAQRLAGAWLLSAEADPLYECLSRRGVTVTPALVVYPALAALRSEDNEIPPEFVEMIEILEQLTFRLYQAGVPLLAGTDVADSVEPIWFEPGVSLHEELLMLERAGVRPSDLIAMASLEVARTVGADSTSGSIEVGKVADFVLLAADPGETAENLQSIVSVFKSGEEIVANR